MPKARKEISRFMDKVQMTHGCWHWIGSTVFGYGRFRRSPNEDSRQCAVHRFAWEYFIGPIPEGKYIDHLCGVRNCVNPYHMELVTNQQNIQRGWTSRGPKRHCPEGHPYSGSNLYVAPNNNGVGCRICRSNQGSEHKRKTRG